MSRKLTSKCDGCGVEVVETDDATPTGIMGVLRRRRGSDRWGSLHVPVEMLPATFDLCEKCTARVMALLELELPKMPSGHATLFPGGYIPMDNELSQQLRSIHPEDSAFGAVPLCLKCGEPWTVRDGKPFCIRCGGGNASSASSICSNCGVGYKGPKPATCVTCGQPT